MARRPAAVVWLYGLLAAALIAAPLMLPAEILAKPHYSTQAAGSVQGEEVATSGAASWHSAGIDGSGVRVAVIDSSFAGYQDRAASGELPASVHMVDLTGGKHLAGDGRGTACAEVIHEMAPGAEIHLIAVEDLAGLGQAKDYCKANDIDIISHSLSWFNTSRGDGSGGPGTPDAIVADARANGILWINSAGDYARHHWAGAFADINNNRWHEFAAGSPQSEMNRFSLPGGASVSIYLKWDAWPATSQNLDLYLYDQLGSTPVAASEAAQQDTQPVEAIHYTNTTPFEASYYVSIRRVNGLTPVRLDLFLLGAEPAYTVPAGSIAEPASSANAMAAGAVHWQTNDLDASGSRGPTLDGRTKPDIAGLSGLTSATFPAGFFGAPAGAATVASAAALVKQGVPAYGPGEIQAFLEDFALDLGEAGKDSQYGTGALRLPDPDSLPITQSISLHTGWNWFSIGVRPSTSPPPSVLASISGTYDYLLGEAGTYAPPPADQGLNTLASIEPGRAYMIRMRQAATLTVTGVRVAPNTGLDLASGWHWIGYLGTGQKSVPEALSSIQDRYGWLLGESGTYAPPPAPGHLNNLTTMEEGRGYLIKMTQEGTLVFEP